MNYIHIRRFIERLQGFEARNAKDFICSVRDAKDLHSDITRLLLDIQENSSQKPQQTPEVITVNVSGGSF
jgi:hypothetical protein